MNLINSSAISSRDGIVQACSLQILSLLVRHLMTVKRTVDPIPLLKIDVTKIMDLFERQITQEQLVSITACGLLSDIVSLEIGGTAAVVQARFN